MEGTSAMYVIQLAYLRKSSEQEDIPPRYLGVALEVGVFGELLCGYDLRENNHRNELPTLQSFIDDSWTYLPNEKEDNIFVTFGRISDSQVSRTIAHLQTGREILASPARFFIVQDDLLVR